LTEDKRRAFFETPIGLLEIGETGGAIVEVCFRDGSPFAASESSPALGEALRQLREYFAGRRRTFDLKLDPRGTAFQKRVWDELLKIPFGRTSSYGKIAASLGRNRAGRAVGAANGKNPISIIIPCHRVVGRTGGLVGYGGGLWRKQWLLRHEGALENFPAEKTQLELRLSFKKE
jgi:methylated-DNA-[protein]-cysteine S-methyltransferase